jgi:acetyl-CoA C-acetyltransferase
VGRLQRLPHGQTAENVAKQWQISRDSRTNSPSLAEQGRSRAEGRQVRTRSSPVTIKGRKGDTWSTGRIHPHGVTMEGMAKLRPAFDKEGTVTAANASGINDGAAATVLMSEAEAAEKRGITPLARIVSWATAGVDPSIMGTGPIPASRKALEKAGWKVDDLDLVEANEAFAAQACAVNKDMGWDPTS